MANSGTGAPKSFYLFFIIYIVFIFLVQVYYHETLYNMSIIALIHLEKYCVKISYAGFIFAFLADIHMTFILVVILYVFSNIYKSFIFLSVVLFNNFIRGLLSLLYKGSRPFWDIKPIKQLFFVCHHSWGTPSFTALSSIVIYLTIFKIIFSTEQMKSYYKTRIVTLIGTLTLIILIDFSGIFQGTESFDQIIFGLTIGFGVYFFCFYVMCVDLNNPDEFYKLLQTRTYKVFLFFVGLFIICIIIYLWDPNSQVFTETQQENINLNDRCSRVGESLKLNNYSLVVIFTLIAVFGAFLGAKFELKYRFNNSYEEWADFNFVKPISDDESLLSDEMNVTKDAQWNHTNSFVSFLRFILTFIFMFLFFLPTLVLPDVIFALNVFIKVAVPSFCYGFFIMYPYKTLLIKMNLTNHNNNFSIMTNKVEESNTRQQSI